MKTSLNRIFLDISFFAALIFKVASFGFSYFPVLDDYIQYGGYPLYENVSHVFLNIGTISTRPFASLLDPVAWGAFYPHLFFVVLIISALFFFGTKLIAASLERLDIHVTPFLYAILLLCPLGFEGTYWISASSRICVGLFFLGLASHFLIKIIDTDKKLFYIPYAIFTLLSFGFYESVMVSSALLQFFITITLTKDNKKRALLLITPVVLGILMLLYYKLFGSIGALGSRANGMSFNNLPQKFYELFYQFFEILIKGGIKTVFFGAKEGLLMLFSVWGIAHLVLAVLISLCCAHFGAKKEFLMPVWRTVLLGFALAFLPLAPNILAETVWLTYRSVVVSFIGLVLISAPLFAKLLKNQKLRFLSLFIIVFLFCAGNINELDTYKSVNSYDDLLVTKICEQLEPEVLSGEKETIVVLDSEVIIPQVSYYKDHVKSVFGSDWALTGAVRAKCKNVKIKMITPVLSLDDTDYKDKQIIYLGGYDE
ncbi:MAG: hypothetical protein IJB50_01185 [Clostridia bacterium]|nr:hypothetical protein [Clostridia bacterium]